MILLSGPLVTIGLLSGCQVIGGTSGTVESGNLVVSGLANATGHRFTWGTPSMSLRLPIGTNLAGSSIYFSFALRVDALGAFASVGTMAGFTMGTGTSFGTKINIRTNGAGGFNLGVSKGSGTTFGNWAAGNYNAGETHFVVGQYKFNTGSGTDDTCDLWINPTNTTFGASNSPSASVAGVGGGGTDLAQIDRFFFRSGGSSATPTKLVTDELRVGFTWASVTPPAPAILKISLINQSVANILWPASLSDFVLEESTNLASPAWNPVNGVSISGTNRFVTVGLSNGSRVYRLRK